MPAIIDLQESIVARAFDSVAESFEDSFENEITRRCRQKIYLTIQRILPSGSTILDINCGIGIDAVNLTKLGYSVTGVDLAPRMIEQAKTRALREGVKVKFDVATFEDLSSLASQTFDLVLSNFGGLNCVEVLDKVAVQVSNVNRVGGYFLAVVMPPVCLWEIVAGLTRLQFKTAFRRLNGHVSATGFGDSAFPVFYHSPRKFIASHSKRYKVKEIHGVNVFSPPPHATKFKAMHALLSRWLENIDESVASIPILRAMGDHFLIVLQRTSQTPP